MRINYGKNVYGKDEINAVVKQLKKTTQMGFISSYLRKKVSRYFGKKIWLDGKFSSAITLALEAINLRDEVIIPCLNFGTALSALIKLELAPVLVDIDIEALQIDINKIRKCNFQKTSIDDS